MEKGSDIKELVALFMKVRAERFLI